LLFAGDAVPVPGDLPVYDDALALVRSVQLLWGIAGIRVLLSAWDEPQYGADAYLRMDRALASLQTIHDAVRASAGTGAGSPDPMDVTRRAAAALGLPPQAVTPLLARTVAAHLRVRDRDNLLAEER
jgi:hydroxyacylglutathione hydrolase